ncbi:hypothetical protein [Streptomyces platensis]
MREHLADGDALADKELADHARVEELLNDLQQREATDQDFDRLVRELRTEVTAHVDDEENNLFTQLRQGVHPERCPQAHRDEVGALPTCGPDDKLKGVLTDRDITVKILGKGRDPQRVAGIGRWSGPRASACGSRGRHGQAGLRGWEAPGANTPL